MLAVYIAKMQQQSFRLFNSTQGIYAAMPLVPAFNLQPEPTMRLQMLALAAAQEPTWRVQDRLVAVGNQHDCVILESGGEQMTMVAESG